MDVGLGIFLAAIIVSLSLLYINRRKDIELPTVRINYTKKPIIKKILIIGVSAILFIAVMCVIYIGISNMPRKQDTYEGIKLGMSMKEVHYIMGRPESIFKEAHESKKGSLIFNPYASNADPEKLGSNDNIFNYPRWNFHNDKSVHIDFDKPNGKVVAIGCSSRYSETHEYCEPLSGISDGMLEDDVKERLGTPDEEEIDNIKTLVFKKLNAEFLLEKQRVIYKILKDPEWVEGSNIAIKK